ncbi:PyrG: CTP synthase [Rubrobacter radiotolerans]|uniref:CTP synthase n=1 Tax=Rubrobacter radiotolerans TaxID=42256 RepID=A0A023X2P0_RUBRA|nr:CTP synthase [Rubrobacter radiotolerans]AHY46737.1 PyrG: CTP synthase [Rubrobacter radiotolerans]MDX5894144.1 CTP synthase [Rubrobacter radiotolerans]SMC05298.1 CTP synthase [Rubrobacter radiotolerans DSM 5868]
MVGERQNADGTKYIFVTGGVVSSIGKGTSAASLAMLLKARGYRVVLQKFDPYINVDPGTMNPYQHGEVFVTEDGAETDLDLGHYERFLGENLGRLSNVTSGSVYWEVIQRERRGDYLGATVQVIPHITNEIKSRIGRLGKDKDIVITEIGGTVGDIESLPFLEAIRQFRNDVGRRNVLYMHVSYVPYIEAAGELKTKPTQHSAQRLREIGISADVLVCRVDRPMGEDIRKKISLFGDVEPDSVIPAEDVESLYDIPLHLHEAGLDAHVLEKLGLPVPEADLDEWRDLVRRLKGAKESVRVAVIGKYIKLKDAYLSVVESLEHAGGANGVKVELDWVDAELLKDAGATRERLSGADGVLVLHGFGSRGIEGKLEAARYARESATPYLGLCLGMQVAVIEYARNVAGLELANSTEFDEDTPHPVIAIMPDQIGVDMGGTMRLGSYPCKLQAGSLARKVYGTDEVQERHRHRYEVNNEYRDVLTEAGMVFSGTSPDGRLVEIAELKDHPFFIASQFHPEFKSRPLDPHPLFRGFVEACLPEKAAPAETLPEESRT